MSKAFCLLNHTLTEIQIKELKEEFGAPEIVYPSEELSKKWSQIPATRELDMTPIQEVIEWLSAAQTSDVLIIQGEFGSTFMLVDYALKRGLIPVHAVTKRVAQEVRIGEKIQKQHTFEHVCFRRYAYYAE